MKTQHTITPHNVKCNIEKTTEEKTTENQIAEDRQPPNHDHIHNTSNDTQMKHSIKAGTQRRGCKLKDETENKGPSTAETGTDASAACRHNNNNNINSK